MDFNWITPQEAAELWGISDRRVQALCANGQVEDAIRLKRGWLIPKGTPKARYRIVYIGVRSWINICSETKNECQWTE